MAKKLKDLVSAAQELNDVLGLDPEIEVEDVSEEELIESVKEGAAQIDLENDEISKKTMDTLRAYEIPVGDDATAADDDDDDATDDAAPAEEEEKPAKKSGKAAPAPKKEEKKETKPAPSKKEEKKEEKSAAKASKKEEEAPAKKKGKVKEGPSFEEIARNLVKEGKSEKEILKTFTDLYKEKGQTDTEYIKKRVGIYMKLASKK